MEIMQTPESIIKLHAVTKILSVYPRVRKSNTSSSIIIVIYTTQHYTTIHNSIMTDITRTEYGYIAAIIFQSILSSLLIFVSGKLYLRCGRGWWLFLIFSLAILPPIQYINAVHTKLSTREWICMLGVVNLACITALGRAFEIASQHRESIVVFVFVLAALLSTKLPILPGSTNEQIQPDL